MPSPNSTFTDMVTTTLRHHVTDIVDNNSNNNALLTRSSKPNPCCRCTPYTLNNLYLLELYLNQVS